VTRCIYNPGVPSDHGIAGRSAPSGLPAFEETPQFPDAPRKGSIVFHGHLQIHGGDDFVGVLNASQATRPRATAAVPGILRDNAR
jgi:hypothetical protein